MLEQDHISYFIMLTLSMRGKELLDGRKIDADSGKADKEGLN